MVPSCGRRYCSARSLALYVAYSICIVLPSACKASPWAVYEGIRDLTQDDVASMATALRYVHRRTCVQEYLENLGSETDGARMALI
jgi:hypothetical protein